MEPLLCTSTCVRRLERLWKRSSTCCCSELMCASICLNLRLVSRTLPIDLAQVTHSSDSLKLLQQFGAYRHSRLRFPQRWHGVCPLHLIFLLLHSLLLCISRRAPETQPRLRHTTRWRYSGCASRVAARPHPHSCVWHWSSTRLEGSSYRCHCGGRSSWTSLARAFVPLCTVGEELGAQAWAILGVSAALCNGPTDRSYHLRGSNIRVTLRVIGCMLRTSSHPVRRSSGLPSRVWFVATDCLHCYLQ